jgi:hypothetical protein
MPTMEAPDPAEIAVAISECMNLLLFFAAPRILSAVRREGAGLDGPGSVASLRRFLHQASGIRARSAEVREGDVARLVDAAILVEEITGTLGAGPGLPDPLPAPVVDRARRALAILGFNEPAGGWDAFDGFPVAYANGRG